MTVELLVARCAGLDVHQATVVATAAAEAEPEEQPDLRVLTA